jgi:hypothetical protein
VAAALIDGYRVGSHPTEMRKPNGERHIRSNFLSPGSIP